MDTTTLQWHDENAAALANKWEATTPQDLHSLLTRWIRPGMAVLELGCGSRRNGLVENWRWLEAHEQSVFPQSRYPPREIEHRIDLQ